MQKFRLAFQGLLLLGILALPVASAKAQSAVEGRWGFQLPDGNGGWLHVKNDNGEWSGSLLWSVGSARPLKSVELEDGELLIQRNIKWRPGGEDKVFFIREPIVCVVDPSNRDRLLMKVTHREGQAADAKSESFQLVAERITEPPSEKPDLSTLKFGEPVKLFNGESLVGWKPLRKNKRNGWRVEAGELVNETPKKDFGAYGSFANLVTEQTFRDFELTIEYNVPKGGNSGVYLRGMYEAQVVDRDSKMQGISGPGAIFGRLKPSVNAGNEGGQWNKYVLTLVKRHITVELNGKKVIDNVRLEGPTGGGILTHDDKPGPIFLQGDHTSVKYRNIVLRPIVD